MALLVFFGLLFVKYIFLHLFTFNLCLFIEIFITFRQCIVGYYFLFIHFDSLYLLLGVFHSVISKVIIGMCWILPLFFVFNLLPLFLISHSPLSCLLLIYLSFLVLHYRFPPLPKGRVFL